MTVLNYEKRKSDGAKLAKSVANDIRKRIERARSGKGDTSPVSLNISGKQIDDDGADQISTALQELLTQTSLGLEELKLSKNEFTASGGRAFAAAIRLAGARLKDVDFSSNKIQVRNDQDACGFEEFLDAFSQCQLLRRLDLSGNDFSGPRALETLNRVYYRHSPVDLPELQHEDQDVAIHDLAEKTRQASLDDSAAPTSLLPSSRGGLRHIPYIVLQNVQMDESGCLFLSYVLAQHLELRYLRPPLKTGAILTQQLNDYDTKSGCLGIIYTTECTTQFGIKLLNDAEQARSHLTKTQEDEDGVAAENVSPHSVASSSGPHLFSSSHRKKRRSSMVSSESGDARTRRKSSVYDLDGLRNKLQRETIEKHGLHSVQLWLAAAKALSWSRLLLPVRFTERADSVVITNRSLVGAKSAREGPLAGALAETTNTACHAKPARASSSTGITPTAATSKLTSVITPSHQDGASPDTAQRATDVIKPEEQAPARYRNHRLTKGWPLPLWKDVIRHLADPHHVLSETQLGSIIEYAMNRSTLGREREIVHKDESTQKWMMLEAIGCLAYELRTDVEGDDAG